MSRRGSEPVEALGPQVDGLEGFPALTPEPEIEEVAPEALPEPAAEEMETPVALLCGSGALVDSVGRLARDCGFAVELALNHAPEYSPDYCQDVKEIPDWRDFVEKCGVDRNYFVCIFVDEDLDCEDILLQCLPSDAAYLGVLGDAGRRKQIFAGLREAGAPDAELAAIACPMGLNIGAVDNSQTAVGIVAEIMAAKAGTLKRLRYNDYKPRK